MPWSKLKNIILAILAATNLCLLLLVAGQALQSGRMRVQARENAILFLQSRGVEVDESIIPLSMDLLPLTAERDIEGEEHSAALLLQGSVTAESPWSRPGGRLPGSDGNGGALRHYFRGIFP